MSAPTLILASASPARAALLRAAGVEPEIRPADVDEEALLAHATTSAGLAALPVPEAVALLARAKAEAVASRPATTARATGPEGEGHDGEAPSAVVIGCDSLLELDGTAYGKPREPAVARERWQRMRGRSGTLHTGHHLIYGEERAHAVSSTVVHFADLTDAEIDAYLATGEPLVVAGAFTLDGFGGAFVTGVEGDPHGVVGLSLPLVRVLLADLGLAWTGFWSARP
ncbi:Maf family nucleotide pyrophosphatase [Ruania suaedae]|uniref:Maf family protein n=1 Tax=Ruania suaedae TaxID=2897774 RepID=UPI001E58747C|nr:Maf family protein [Ruania suaedae]UFU02276.1 Maf family nucleotide pyrophosphatase [Ruania suaedae]